MINYFNGTFFGKEQKDKNGKTHQSELELGGLSYNEVRDALKKVIEKKDVYELTDFILYDMFELLNDEQQEELVRQHYKAFKLAFKDKIEEADEKLAEDVANGEYDD